MAQDRRTTIRAAEKLVARGKLEAAIKQYKKVLRAKPDDTGTLNRLGDLYVRLNRLDEAVEIFQRAAEYFVNEGFLVKAIAIFKKIIRLDQTRIAAYETLADLYHRQGLRNEARSQYQVVADYYQQAGDATKVRTIYERMVELEPNNPSHRVKLAEHYCEAEMLSEAMDQYQLIASFMLDHDRVGEAVRVYRGAFTLNPTDLGFLTDVVLHLVDCGQREAANQLLTEAIKKNPEATRVREVTGLVARTEPESAEVPPAVDEIPGETLAEVDGTPEPDSDQQSPPGVRDGAPPAGALPGEQPVSPSDSALEADAVLPALEVDESLVFPGEAQPPEVATVETSADAAGEGKPPATDELAEDVVVLDLESDATALPFAVDSGPALPARPPDEQTLELEIDLDAIEVEEDLEEQVAETEAIEAEQAEPAAPALGVEDLIDELAVRAAEEDLAAAEAGDVPPEVSESDVVVEATDLSPVDEPDEFSEVTSPEAQAEEMLPVADVGEDEVAASLLEEDLEAVEGEPSPAIEEVEAAEVQQYDIEVSAPPAEAPVEAAAAELVEMPRAGELLSEARVLVNYGLDAKAVDLCERALEIDPDVAGGWGLLIEILHDSGQMVVAAQRAERAREALGEGEGQWIEIQQRLTDRGYRVRKRRIDAPVEPEQVSAELIEVEPQLIERTSPGWLEIDHSSEQSFAEGEGLFGSEDEFFDLAAELEQELRREEVEESGEFNPQLQEQSLEEIVEGFKRGVSETLSEEDYETHYNLGIAYREMGLLDEAIGEFQLAAKAPAYLVDCCSLLGSCFLEKGFPDLAIKWYERGLEAPQVSENESLGLLYELGNLYLITGDKEVARKTFAEIYGVNSNYRDVVAKLEELKVT